MSVHHLVWMQTKSASTFQERPFVTANQETMKFKMTVLEVRVYKVLCVLPREVYASITCLTAQPTSFLSNEESSEAERLLPVLPFGFEVFTLFQNGHHLVVFCLPSN